MLWQVRSEHEAQICTMERTWLVWDGSNTTVNTCLLALIFMKCFSLAYIQTEILLMRNLISDSYLPHLKPQYETSLPTHNT